MDFTICIAGINILFLKNYSHFKYLKIISLHKPCATKCDMLRGI